jgi:hypothetical protein
VFTLLKKCSVSLTFFFFNKTGSVQYFPDNTFRLLVDKKLGLVFFLVNAAFSLSAYVGMSWELGT